MDSRLAYFKSQNKLLEYQRLMERTNYDIEMLSETGFCRGVENYSAPLSLRKKGQTPTTLIDFFKDDFLLVVDESHVTIPQVRGMYNGDRARKEELVNYGFRLKSALDNRPLNFKEFESKVKTAIYMSATPGEKEEGQIDDIIKYIDLVRQRNERMMITTLTIKMAEELTNYLKKLDIKVAYLHNEIKTLQRIQIIRDLRIGKYDVLVGINLLREGLDIPEVSVVAILDADKQGFLRSDKSLIQTIGRAARNSNGLVLMYANKISDAMKIAIEETKRRRSIQEEYNSKNNIIPKTIIKSIPELITNNKEEKDINSSKMSKKEKLKLIDTLEQEMKLSAEKMDFERAMELRDIIFELKEEIN